MGGQRVAVGNSEVLGEVGVRALYLEVVHKTVWTHSSKRSITSAFENLNTVHPSERRRASFFLSEAFLVRAQ
jgi:hypothetical protein